MPDVQDASVWTVPSTSEGEPDRKYVLTIDVNPATGKPEVGARDVTYDEDYQDSASEPLTLVGADESGAATANDTTTDGGNE